MHITDEHNKVATDCGGQCKCKPKADAVPAPETVEPVQPAKTDVKPEPVREAEWKVVWPLPGHGFGSFQ